MRRLVALALLLPSPALAQFPPPGVYDCAAADGSAIGVLSLLVAGDYQWDANGSSANGQVASSGSSVEALTGPLAGQHWRGEFSTGDSGGTTFQFETDIGIVTCSVPPL